jgi:type 1 glutamine amidotransferase
MSPRFPGVAALGKTPRYLDEWYSLKNFAANLHVILLQETRDMTDWCYERPPYPASWARMHEKGRVFYSSFGHRDDIWTNPHVKAFFLGGIAWALGRVDADITPNLAQAAPQADRLPKFPPPPKPK